MRALLGFIFGLLISVSLAKFAGDNPWTVIQVIVSSAFGSVQDLSLTLFYMTSLVFAGLSVAVAFHGGLFNIGAEGQLTVAALAAAAVGAYLPELPGFVGLIFSLAAALLAGAVWGLIPGILRAYRGSHEVIITMMMNFIAAGISSWLVLNLIKNPDSQNPESAPIPESFLLGLIPGSERPLNLCFIFAILIAVGLYFYLYRTTWGYELRSVGYNETTSQIAGINPLPKKVWAMTLAGLLAAFVGINEVLGASGKFKIGFSPEFGFSGIAVALLARNNPLGILLSAFLFAVLHKGAVNLDIETQNINKDFAKIIQAIIIFSVAGFYFYDFQRLKNLFRRKN